MLHKSMCGIKEFFEFQEISIELAESSSVLGVIRRMALRHPFWGETGGIEDTRAERAQVDSLSRDGYHVECRTSKLTHLVS